MVTIHIPLNVFQWIARNPGASVTAEEDVCRPGSGGTVLWYHPV